MSLTAAGPSSNPGETYLSCEFCQTTLAVVYGCWDLQVGYNLVVTPRAPSAVGVALSCSVRVGLKWAGRVASAALTRLHGRSWGLVTVKAHASLIRQRVRFDRIMTIVRPFRCRCQHRVDGHPVCPQRWGVFVVRRDVTCACKPLCNDLLVRCPSRYRLCLLRSFSSPTLLY